MVAYQSVILLTCTRYFPTKQEKNVWICIENNLCIDVLGGQEKLMLIVCQLIIAVVMTLQIIAMGMILGHCHGDDNLGSLLWGWPLVWGVIGLYSSTAAIVHRKCTLNMQHYERCNSDRGCRFKANILCFSECVCLLWRARLLQIWTQIFVCFYYGHIVFRGKKEYISTNHDSEK